MIRAVLFDLDHTLFDHESAARDGLAALTSAMGVAVTPEVDELWFRIEDEQYAKYMAGELDLYGQRRSRYRMFSAAMTGTGHDIGDDAADAAWQNYYDGYISAWRAFDESIPALELLRQRGLKIGIITNGHHQQQVSKTERSGLAPLLDVVVSSEDTGIAKPDPRIFVLACERLGVDPSEAVFVGDNIPVDVVGALDSGMDALHIVRGTITDRDREAMAQQPTADYETITRIDDVLTWLDRRDDA